MPVKTMSDVRMEASLGYPGTHMLPLRGDFLNSSHILGHQGPFCALTLLEESQNQFLKIKKKNPCGDFIEIASIL